MDKFYKIRDDLKKWDVNEISNVMKKAVEKAGVHFEHWKGTVEVRKPNGDWADASLHHEGPDKKPLRITNGDINLTTNLTEYPTLPEQLFGGSGRRARIVDGQATEQPRIPDKNLSELVPEFKGTILEDLHIYMQNYFQAPIRMRAQNRTVNGTSQGLYWHKDDPVENRFHIPLWTNPGHVLLFTTQDFKWKLGFDKEEAMKPMDFVGHYVPPDGRVYEMFTKNYMHSVASVGVGWLQPRHEQTRCHLSFWIAKD